MKLSRLKSIPENKPSYHLSKKLSFWSPLYLLPDFLPLFFMISPSQENCRSRSPFPLLRPAFFLPLALKHAKGGGKV